jgi:hypothetical protein
MIFRLTQMLTAKIKAGTLGTVPLSENPLADWSAQLFSAARMQYILLSNTKSLYSTLFPAKGINDESDFIDRALASLREALEAKEQGHVYRRFIALASASVQFAKALNRSVTGSMNDLMKHAAFYLVEGELSPLEISSRLNDTPLSELGQGSSHYSFPRDVFDEMVRTAGQ